MRPKVVVINGYGCHLNDEVRRYLEKVTEWIRRERPQLVMPSGGQTQQHTAPGMSEAKLITRYLFDETEIEAELHEDRDSFTTYDNVRNAAAAIRKHFKFSGSETIVSHCDVTIFCEATRALKVAILARHFFGFPPVKIETVSWELMDPRKELFSTAYDLLSIRIPWLAERWRRKRMERAKHI